jgi:hypothetical protein
MPFRMLEAMEVIPYLLEVLEVMRYVLESLEVRRVQEVLEGDALCAALYAGDRGWRMLCAGGVRCVLLCMLEAVEEGVFCLLEVIEMMRCMLLCILEIVEVVCFVLEAVEVVFGSLEVLKVMRWMRRMLLPCQRLWRFCTFCWRP